MPLVDQGNWSHSTHLVVYFEKLLPSFSHVFKTTLFDQYLIFLSINRLIKFIDIGRLSLTILIYYCELAVYKGNSFNFPSYEEYTAIT